MNERLAHPASEFWSAIFHGGFASWFAFGLILCSLGTWFHITAAQRHLRDANSERRSP